ncbi:helix-turn-helix domain-containing protein, partial [Burkholderia vietnamiensis]
MDTLQMMRIFVRVAEEGSFTSAAQRLDITTAYAVAGRRKGAGDGRRNGASRTGGKTRIRTVSRLRFFAVFGNCIL